MSLVSIVPESGSLVGRGDIITITWSKAWLPYVAYRPPAGPDEVISSPSFTSSSIGSGYTGEYDVDGTNYTISFKRDAGWPNASFIISIYDGQTGVESQPGYTVLAEGQYPPDMQPFTDPATGGGGAGEILIQDSGAAQGSATTLNLADNLTATVASGVATINADDTGTDIVVMNDSQTVAVALTKMTFTGAGVTATAPGLSNEVIVTVPGGAAGSGGQEVVANVITDGGGGYTISTNSSGIDSATVGIRYVTVHWTIPFADDDYFIQVTPKTRNLNGWYAAFGARTQFAATILLFDAAGDIINPGTEIVEFDIVAQSSSAGSGAGDVSSSESAGTVNNGELAQFDGTTGKRIKGVGAGVFSQGGTIFADTHHASTALSSGGIISASSPTAYIYVTEYNVGAPTGAAGGGIWWVRNEVGTANTPMFTDGAGTEYDLTEGTGGGGGTVDSVVAGTGVTVNSADSANPIVSTNDAAIVHDNLFGFVPAEHLDWSSDLGGTVIHANNYTSGSGITSWNGQSGAVTSVYVQAADPDLTITPNPGDIWIEIP